MAKPPRTTHLAVGEPFFTWTWGKGETDWAYPLSVDGHIFDRLEFLAMLQLIPFKAPNSLEHHLQVFLPLFSNRLGVAYPTSRQVNLPLNRVQQEFANSAGQVDPDFLLEKWNQGLAMDWRLLKEYPNCGVHEDIEISFCPRTKEGK